MRRRLSKAEGEQGGGRVRWRAQCHGLAGCWGPLLRASENPFFALKPVSRYSSYKTNSYLESMNTLSPRRQVNLSMQGFASTAFFCVTAGLRTVVYAHQHNLFHRQGKFTTSSSTVVSLPIPLISPFLFPGCMLVTLVGGIACHCNLALPGFFHYAL